MRNIRVYISALLIVMGISTAYAYDIDYRGCYKSIILNYQSVDGTNSPVTLSERVTIPLEKDKNTYREISFVMLSSPSKAAINKQASSGEASINAGLIAHIATDGALVVEPDLMGYGADAGNSDVMFMNPLHARQALDGLNAALDYVRDNSLPIKSDFYTLNFGYSKGGAVAAEVQRYIEQYYTQEQRDRIHFRKTICGGGALVPSTVILGLLQSDGMVPGSTAAEMVHGVYEAFKASTLNAYKLNDIFTDEFLATGLLDKILSREYDDNQLYMAFMETYQRQDPLVPFSRIFQPAVYTPTSPLFRALYKSLEQCNVITGWVPETPIDYIHLLDDPSVPYIYNVDKAKAAWGDKLNIMSTDLSSYDWNCVPMHYIADIFNEVIPINEHVKLGFGVFFGMLDGCMRGDKISSTYNAAYDTDALLNVIFDVFSQTGFPNFPIQTEIDSETTLNAVANLTSIDKAGKLTIDITGAVVKNATGEATPISITVTLAPDPKEQGHLIAAIKFNITIPNDGNDITITGECTDIMHLTSAISAIFMRPTFSKKSDAEKYANSVNNYFKCKVKAKVKVIIDISAGADIYAGVTTDGPLFGAKTYTVEPYYKVGIISGKLDDLVKTITGKDIAGLIGIEDGKNLTVGIDDYNAEIILKERSNGKAVIDIDLNKKTGEDYAYITATMTPAALTNHTDATLETLNIDFVATLAGGSYVIKGKCANLNDAIGSVIAAGCNQHFATADAAQRYADDVNSRVQCAFYDGDTYIGKIYAKVVPGSFGNYMTACYVNVNGEDILIDDYMK